MTIVRAYRLPSLVLLVTGVIALQIGFFFIWVLAPLVVIGGFYIVYLALRDTTLNGLGRARRGMLREEAGARRRELHPDESP